MAFPAGEVTMRKFMRWQVIWALLVAVWVIYWFAPVLLAPDWDYFAIWAQLVLIPSITVYIIGIFIGVAVKKAIKGFKHFRPANWQAHWLLISIAWAAVVGIYLIAAPATLNPIYFFSRALVMPLALTIMLLPPVLLYWAMKGVLREE